MGGASAPGLGLLETALAPVALIDSVAPERSTAHPGRDVFVFPCSFAQQRLWFLDQLAPGSPAYTISAPFFLDGPLDVAALEGAVKEVVRRHEVLRTTFRAVDGMPVQVVAPSADVPFEVVDLRALAPGPRSEEARRRAAEEVRRPFDLARGPLVRAVVVWLEDHRQVLMVSMHHIVSDGWSVGVLRRELGLLYRAFATAQPSPLAELPVQYADFALWQRRWLASGVREAQLRYWRQALAGAPATLELPTDRPRPPVQRFVGARQSVALDAELTEALRALAQAEGATLFMVLLGAFSVLLGRLAGQDDVVVGTPIANRTRTEIEGLVGFFVNTLVLRTDLSGDPSFRHLLGRVREAATGAYAHQDLPFEEVVRELAPRRQLSHMPLFQVMFNMVGNMEGGAGTGLDRRPPSRPHPGGNDDGAATRWRPDQAKFDLTLYAADSAGRIRLSAVYNTDLFDHGTAARMLADLEAILGCAAAHPDGRLSGLLAGTKPAGDAAPRVRPSVVPASPFVPWEAAELDQSIGQRFDAQAAEHRDRWAVVTDDHRLTYGELAASAGGVRRAVSEACGRDRGRVALLFTAGAPMLASLLGVLGSGRAYVPLDPAHPPARLEQVMSDAAVGAVVAEPRTAALARALVGASGLPVVEVDLDGPAFAGPDALAPDAAGPDDLAYLLYTSGSTGTPKGVMQSHRNVLHYIRAYTHGLRLTHHDRLTLVSSYGFDGAVMDIFGALLNGASVHPFPVRDRGVDGLARFIAERGITVFHSTPSVFRAFASTLRGDEVLDGVRLVVFGGEEAQRSDYELFRRHFAAAVLVNGLGSTECSLALQASFDGDSRPTRTSLSVGEPVGDTEVLLVDDHGAPVPPGQVGEIAVRSNHVALGYWRRPEATAAAFIPDPDGGTRRTYRTGDLGRRRPDGIEFAGRKDSQVKLRGYRIELGEIEVQLRTTPGVREAAVMARHDGPDGGGERRLVAYVVPHELPGPAVGELRRHLARVLPDYMLPAAFVVLDTLPLTPNGKLDRAALPAPERARPRPEEAFVAPAAPPRPWPASGPRCSTSNRSGWRTTSSSSGATPCWPPRWCPAYATPSTPRCPCGPCSRRPPWPRWRPGSPTTPEVPNRSTPSSLDPAPLRRRCRLPSSGCGSSISWPRAAPPTPSPPPSSWTAPWTWPPWSGR
nr:condensation domain-containing protein [uncultured bacterium]